ncbi:MAG: glycoside hydrolase family 5 protein [Ruminococcus sp.]|nr:glycoside hydrolase family 5 protein [Ruminococcus sp.]
MLFTGAAGGCGKKEKKKSVSVSGIETNDKGTVDKELTSLELQRLMGNGINLGNTMEAYGHGALSPDSEPSAFETRWGQPVTTQEMIDGMKDAGFDSLRIPVAWTNAMDFESGDYTIDPQYLDRVEEIVNYALNDDMYVIINDHWDGSWWGMFGSHTQETRDQAMELYKSMWTQISERFKNYSDHLIFEGANEELGDRLNDKDIAKDSGALTKPERYEMTNLINQTFVDTVRATGGNNADRFLLIPGYNTDITNTCDDRFVMPNDTAKDKLLISVHYYTPWDYCGTQSVDHWGSVLNYEEQNRLFEMMTKFTEQGYGVIIGEFAVALNSDGSVKSDTDKFIKNVYANCDLYGYCPMLWDCSSLYKRTQCEIPDQTMAQVFLEARYENEKDMTDEELQADARARLDEYYAEAQANAEDIGAIPSSEDTAVAWIMYQSSDYSVSYCVGDTYDPTSYSNGVKAENVLIEGEGTYTVSLDLSQAGGGNGFAFSALGIYNGEKFYPGYIIDITDIKINGESVEQSTPEYTNSDDGNCTRVNIYNGWVSDLPDDARTADGSLEGCSPIILDTGALPRISRIDITFDYIAP